MYKRLQGLFAAVLVAVLGVAGLAAAPSAMAASYLDASVSPMFTQVGADVSTLIGYGWILFGIIVGGLIAFTIVKKVLHKSVGK